MTGQMSGTAMPMPYAMTRLHMVTSAQGKLDTSGLPQIVSQMTCTAIASLWCKQPPAAQLLNHTRKNSSPSACKGHNAHLS